MSTIATSSTSASRHDAVASIMSNGRPDDIVEVSLLLPSQWANELIELSRERRQSVGQIIRSMIGHALHDGA